ncbi:nucleotide-sugar transporter-domain-containing protein [Absidia repens]|uniref:Nucleotide-sugar transporter-domain-containing protein n=1 Tax=Absidia repens TaxID=90262 RepID=A0A1X2ISP2_9FUNG|nr:nucleotide-sugar transporter-domain-containing protein [Absidia repens]
MGFLDARSVKWISLLVLVIQNSALILIMRYSRASVNKDQLYLASTAVVMSEGLKTLLCLAVLSQLIAPPSTRLGAAATFNSLVLFLRRDMLHNWPQALKLGIPAILYLIQNNLQYVAATHLDAATFQVTYQLKILTTAFFSVTMLHRSLSRKQWTALGLLTIGIALAMIPVDVTWSDIRASLFSSSTSTTTIAPSSTIPFEDFDRDTLAIPKQNQQQQQQQQLGNSSDYQGFMAVLMACTLSGLAGVYFEKLLKSAPSYSPSSHSPSSSAAHLLPIHQPTTSHHDYDLKKKLDDVDESSMTAATAVPATANVTNSTISSQYQQQQQLWLRNLHMSFFSAILGLIFMVGLQDGKQVMMYGFFANYNKWTWCVIVIQALGGLIVALVVKYADNILKGFCTCISIIISSVISIWLFHVSISSTFLVGASLVIYATCLYGIN